MISAKMVFLCFLEINVMNDVTSENLSRESNYMVDVVMWPKFLNSNISMRKVIIISILQGFDQKKPHFLGVPLVQV